MTGGILPGNAAITGSLVTSLGHRGLAEKTY